MDHCPVTCIEDCDLITRLWTMDHGLWTFLNLGENLAMNGYGKTSHEIDYKILGEEMQCVEIELDPEETAIAESGAFMMMDDGIQMQTIFGDGTGQQKGLLGKLMSAGKRLLTGESLFMTTYTNVGTGKKKVYFASPYPGKVIPLDLIRL